MDIESLYLLVTEAILRAEALQDLGAPGASNSFLDLSLIEEEIARLLPASDPEGAIARRGAVRAAVVAGDMNRARRLVDQFGVEAGATGELRDELKGLLPANDDGHEVREEGQSSRDSGRSRRWSDLQRVAAGLPPLGDAPGMRGRARDGALRVHVGRETMEEVLSRTA